METTPLALETGHSEDSSDDWIGDLLRRYFAVDLESDLGGDLRHGLLEDRVRGLSAEFADNSSFFETGFKLDAATDLLRDLLSDTPRGSLSGVLAGDFLGDSGVTRAFSLLGLVARGWGRRSTTVSSLESEPRLSDGASRATSSSASSRSLSPDERRTLSIPSRSVGLWPDSESQSPSSDSSQSDASDVALELPPLANPLLPLVKPLLPLAPLNTLLRLGVRPLGALRSLSSRDSRQEAGRPARAGPPLVAAV